jgi:hypothetical protein
MSVLGLIVSRMRPRLIIRVSAVILPDIFGQGIDQFVGYRGTETGCRVPTWSGLKALDAYVVAGAILFDHRVIAAGHVEEIRGVIFLISTNLVERRIDKAQAVSGFLVGNRQDGCPLW